MISKALAVLVALAPLAALAQGELGLDLSEEKTPAAFRPSVAFVGVTPSAAEEPLTARAKLLEAELLKAITESERFSVVKAPVDVAGVTTTARKCTDFACLEALAEKLGVHRIITASLAKAGPATLLSVSGFDQTLPAVLPMQVESGEKAEKAQLGGFSGIAGKSQAQRDKDFVAKVKGPFGELLKNIATPLGKLAIDVIEQKAVTRVRGKEMGTGTFEKALPAGSYEVEVVSDEYQPFTTTVVIEPMKRVEVKVSLVAKPVEAPVEAVVAAEPSTVFYKRPGLYVLLGGAALVGIGLAFGSMAKSIENRAADADHDGYSDITRAQANGAKTQATLANVFVIGGAVVAAAGLTWFFIVPLITSDKAPSGSPRPSGPGDPAEGAGAGVTGMAIGFGSAF